MGALDQPADGRHVTEVLRNEISRPRAKRRSILAVAGWTVLAFASVALFLVSRGKWSHAIIDSGREWIVPDALARGELLYGDVVYWFGPFTPYFHAAFFRVIGSGFGTLVVAGVVASLAVIGALFFALRRVVTFREAFLWTAIATAALVWMPYSGGAILSMGYRMWHAAVFALVAVALSCRRRRGRSTSELLLIGALCAFAGLCRTEWGLAAVLGTVGATAAREGLGKHFFREAGVIGTAFLLVFGVPLAAFVVLAGPGPVLREGHVLLTGLPAETKTFLLKFSGLSDWPRGLLQLLYSSCLWLTALLGIELWASYRADPDRFRRRLPWLAGGHLFLALYPEFGGPSSVVLFSAAPLACAISILVGIRRPSGRLAAALVGFGLLGILLSLRKVFFIGDFPYVGPPLLFAFVAVAALARHRILAEKLGSVRLRLRIALLFALLALAAYAFGARAVQYRRDGRVAIAGTKGMLSAEAGAARSISLVVHRIRRDTSAGDHLVVIPEGELLNYLSGRRNPLRHKLYIPGYLTAETEPKILAELERLRPAAIVVLKRFAGEYGRAYFGRHYGARTAEWIQRNYSEVPFDSAEKFAPDAAPWGQLYLRRR